MKKRRKRKVRLVFSAVLSGIIFFTAICWYLSDADAVEAPVKKELTVSLESGFYTADQEIQVEAPEGSAVYYTDNCEIPDRETGYRYTGPIPVEAPEEEAVQVYRFKAYYDDDTESPVITRSYFMGKDIDSRYTTNVLHVVGDPEDLFGYEHGIFVGGRLFDEFMEENQDAIIGAGVEANFNLRGREAEREAYIEYFSREGETLFAVNGGVRIHGESSRMKNQKSFRLYARKEYDEVNEFRYPVIDRLVSQDTGVIAGKHKRLLARSGGTDNGFAFIRGELVGELAGQAGFPDVMYAEPVCVYLNHTYYGIYWLENMYDKQYFENRYGAYTGEFVEVSGIDLTKDDVEDPAEQEYVEEFNEQYLKYANLDLTVDENYWGLEEFLDVENYLQYYAINNYVGNGDWPDNNVKAYRYVAGEDGYRAGTVFDGRYRHLLFDVDHGFGLRFNGGAQGINAEDKTLERIVGNNSPMFGTMMKRRECMDYFVNYTCDLMNGAMSPENVYEVFSRMHESRDPEIYHMLVETDLMKDSLWTWEDEPTYESMEEYCDVIVQFAKDRPAAVLEDITQTFGYDGSKIYTLYVSKYADSDIRLNSLDITEDSFAGTYFGEVPVVLTPRLAINEIFSHWLVNGDIYEEERLEITAEDIINGEVSVELIVEDAADPVLQFNAVRAKGDNDYIELINTSDQMIHTSGYFLSDREDIHQYILPGLTVRPGEILRFYGNNCSDMEALGHYGLNFSLKQGETLTLAYGNQVIEELTIPDLAEGSIYQRNAENGRFAECLSGNIKE